MEIDFNLTRLQSNIDKIGLLVGTRVATEYRNYEMQIDPHRQDKKSPQIVGLRPSLCSQIFCRQTLMRIN